MLSSSEILLYFVENHEIFLSHVQLQGKPIYVSLDVFEEIFETRNWLESTSNAQTPTPLCVHFSLLFIWFLSFPTADVSCVQPLCIYIDSNLYGEHIGGGLHWEKTSDVEYVRCKKMLKDLKNIKTCRICKASIVCWVIPKLTVNITLKLAHLR